MGLLNFNFKRARESVSEDRRSNSFRKRSFGFEIESPSSPRLPLRFRSETLKETATRRLTSVATPYWIYIYFSGVEVTYFHCETMPCCISVRSVPWGQYDRRRCIGVWLFHVNVWSSLLYSWVSCAFYWSRHVCFFCTVCMLVCWGWSGGGEGGKWGLGLVCYWQTPKVGIKEHCLLEWHHVQQHTVTRCTILKAEGRS